MNQPTIFVSRCYDISGMRGTGEDYAIIRLATAALLLRIADALENSRISWIPVITFDIDIEAVGDKQQYTTVQIRADLSPLEGEEEYRQGLKDFVQSMQVESETL